MTSLKDLIKLKPKVNSIKVELNENELPEPQLSYFQRGFGDSKNSMGHPSAFTIGLFALYQSYMEKCRVADKEQWALKQPLVDEQNRIQTEIERKETFMEIKESECKDLREDIHKIENDIAEVKVDPQKFGIKADKRPKAQFYIGLLVLLPITIYLLVFYMSASYSAFFKEFSTDELTAAIFDAKTYNKALKDGMMELIFVCTIPFAFMGLGYLIHMFQKNKAIFKIVALFVITFLFDAILAYQIDKKVYDFNRTLNSPDFNLEHAIQSVSFWGIIFAGFVVYIIWGLVFDFIMKEYDNLDKVAQYIRKLKEDKSNLATRLSGVKISINNVKEEISNLKGKARELQAQIDGFIFPKQKYLVLHAKYTKGWLKAIFKEIALPSNEKDRLIHACLDAEKAHLRKYSLGEENAGNTIYYTNPDSNE